MELSETGKNATGHMAKKKIWKLCNRRKKKGWESK
jgi:hypothetical protein